MDYIVTKQFIPTAENLAAARAHMKICDKIVDKMLVNPKARIRNKRLLKKGMASAKVLVNMGITIN